MVAVIVLKCVVAEQVCRLGRIALATMAWQQMVAYLYFGLAIDLLLEEGAQPYKFAGCL